jgi:hypothetical protein
MRHWLLPGTDCSSFSALKISVGIPKVALTQAINAL